MEKNITDNFKEKYSKKEKEMIKLELELFNSNYENDKLLFKYLVSNLYKIYIIQNMILLILFIIFLF